MTSRLLKFASAFEALARRIYEDTNNAEEELFLDPPEGMETFRDAPPRAGAEDEPFGGDEPELDVEGVGGGGGTSRYKYWESVRAGVDPLSPSQRSAVEAQDSDAVLELAAIMAHAGDVDGLTELARGIDDEDLADEVASNILEAEEKGSRGSRFRLAPPIVPEPAGGFEEEEESDGPTEELVWSGRPPPRGFV